MEVFFSNVNVPSNVSFYGAAHGNCLLEHFKWSNLIINPGHVGLLVMNAASHNRPIVIDKNSDHAPEVILAEEGRQFFIDFSDTNEVLSFFYSIEADLEILSKKGTELYNLALEKYTVEFMVEVHRDIVRRVLN